MDTLLQDVRYAARSLMKSPGFTLVAVLTLALGIGASTALFSAVDALLLRPLPVLEPARLLEIRSRSAWEGMELFSYPQYEALRDRSRTLEGVAAAERTPVNFGDAEYTEERAAHFVSGDYFDVLGVRPGLGRLFTPADDGRGGADAGVVVSYRLWQRRLGGDSTVVGRTVLLNGHPTVVVGVAPAGFSGTRVDQVADLWAPLALHAQVVPNSSIFSPMSYGLSLIGRLRPGVTPQQAGTELNALASQIREETPGPMKLEGVALRAPSRIPVRYEGAVLRFVAMLAVATGLVLLIANVNVAGMLLVRGAVRGREIAVRAALGAERKRLVRQLLTESVLLWLLAGTGGVLLAVWMTDLLLAFRWPMPITLEVGVDPRVLGFALLLSLGTGVVFSLLPALRSSRPDLAAALKGAGRGRPRGGIRMRSAFVVGQVAMSLVLLVAAGLFLRALERALSIDPGFEPSGVTVAKLDLHRLRYEEPQGRQLYQQILEAVQRVPGVEAASLSAAVPLGPGGEMLGIAPLGAAAAERKGDFIHANVVTPAYFRTMQIPLLRGRGFTDADRESTPRVVVVSLAMAEQLWPGEDPVGQRFRQEFSAMQLMLGGDQEPAEYEVVGVVPDHKTTSLREERAPHLYLPLSQSYRPRVVLAVRTRGDASPAAAAVRAQLRALAPDLPMLEFAPLRDLIGNALLAQRIGATLTTLFGVLGLLLTAIGVYGVMAYAVEQRTREIGIRMALGAQRGSVLALVLRRSVALTALGLAVGFVAALAATRLIASLLYGVSASDPVAFAVGALLLGAVALLASYLPARRATRVDPMVALRDG